MAGKAGKQVAVADAGIASITIQSTDREELDGLVVNRVTYQGRASGFSSASGSVRLD